MIIRWRGQVLNYQGAMYLKRHETRSILYTDDPSKGGQWVADVPLEAIIESNIADPEVVAQLGLF